MKRLTNEWVRRAEADYRAAGRLHQGSDPLPGQVCFFCQQYAEKHLKALLEELGPSVPRTHVLGDLLILLLPHYPLLRSLRRGMSLLTRFAVGPRYPGYRASKREANAAFRWAGKVRDAIRQLLGVHPSRRGSKGPP